MNYCVHLKQYCTSTTPFIQNKFKKIFLRRSDNVVTTLVKHLPETANYLSLFRKVMILLICQLALLQLIVLGLSIQKSFGMQPLDIQ